MLQAYPVELERLDNGAVLATFPDVPGAMTQGDDEELALHWAQDALLVTLAGYMELGRDIPPPSPADGRELIPVPPMPAMKLAIYQAMREQRLTRVALAERLGVDEKMVRRLLDLDHASKLSQLEAALRALGRRVLIDVVAMAR